MFDLNAKREGCCFNPNPTRKRGILWDLYIPRSRVGL
jgi:hypothetical protein